MFRLTLCSFLVLAAAIPSDAYRSMKACRDWWHSVVKGKRNYPELALLEKHVVHIAQLCASENENISDLTLIIPPPTSGSAPGLNNEYKRLQQVWKSDEFRTKYFTKFITEHKKKESESVNENPKASRPRREAPAPLITPPVPAAPTPLSTHPSTGGKSPQAIEALRSAALAREPALTQEEEEEEEGELGSPIRNTDEDDSDLELVETAPAPRPAVQAQELTAPAPRPAPATGGVAVDPAVQAQELIDQMDWATANRFLVDMRNRITKRRLDALYNEASVRAERMMETTMKKMRTMVRDFGFKESEEWTFSTQWLNKFASSYKEGEE